MFLSAVKCQVTAFTVSEIRDTPTLRLWLSLRSTKLSVTDVEINLLAQGTLQFSLFSRVKKQRIYFHVLEISGKHCISQLFVKNCRDNAQLSLKLNFSRVKVLWEQLNLQNFCNIACSNQPQNILKLSCLANKDLTRINKLQCVGLQSLNRWPTKIFQQI